MPIATPVTSHSGVYNDHNQYDQDELENDRGDHDGDGDAEAVCLAPRPNIITATKLNTLNSFFMIALLNIS